MTGFGSELLPMPALLTRISTGPKASFTAAMTFLHAARSLRSATIAQLFPPPALILPTTSSSSLAVRAVTATLAPSRAKSRAIARPIPRPAPVTRATLSCSFGMRRPPEPQSRAHAERGHEAPRVGTSHKVMHERRYVQALASVGRLGYSA